jgi:hypothetical protein
MSLKSKPILIGGKNVGTVVKGGSDNGWPAFIATLAGTGPMLFVKNFDAQIHALVIDNLVLPVTVNGGREDTCFASSPTEFYVHYANEEIGRRNGGSIPLTIALLNKLSLMTLRLSNADRIAYVNNWPVWTNPYPDLCDFPIEEVTKLLVDTFPHHVIGFRSLNRVFHGEFLSILESAGYLTIPANHTYVCDFRDAEWKVSKVLRGDLNFLKKPSLYRHVEHHDIRSTDYSRIAWLYQRLNVLKYTDRNPRFTEEFFRVVHQNGIAQLFGLRSQDGNLEAVMGDIDSGGVRVNLFSGYNTDTETSDRLFRLLVAKTFEEAFKNCHGLNLGAASGGAAQFKRFRGAKPTLEFNAYYVDHLPWLSKTLLRAFKASVERNGVAIMRKFQL